MAERILPTVSINGRQIAISHVKLNQYSKTLGHELLSAGAISRERIAQLRAQTDSLLRARIDQWNACHPGSIDFEQREKLSRDIDRTIDAYLFSTGSLQSAAEALMDRSAEEMYLLGQNYLRRVRLETTGMAVRLRHTAYLLGNAAYERAPSQILSALSVTTRHPDARRISDRLDYPPAVMSFTHSGLFYLQKYTYHLMWENEFCSRYDPQEIAGLIEIYCDRHKLDLRSCKTNFYLPVLKNAVFCEYLDKEPGTLAIYEDECEIAEQLLSALPDEELTHILFRLTDRLIGGNRAYNHRVMAAYMHKFVNAIRCGHLKDTLTVIEL